MIKQYDSIAAMGQDFMRLGASYEKSILRFETDSWFGDETESESLAYTLHGKADLVPQAAAILDQLDTSLSIPRRTWEAAPSGAYACVPDVLAGRPRAMRRLTQELDDSAPITILAMTTTSASIDSATIMKRGIAIVTLAMALSRIRPCTLHTCNIGKGLRDGTHETIITAQINTAPLDLATAAYVLTSAGFARRITYSLEHELNGFSGNWPPGFYDGAEAYYKTLPGKLGLDPTRTLIIPAAKLNEPMIHDPIAWINQTIAKLAASNKEAFA